MTATLAQSPIVVAPSAAQAPAQSLLTVAPYILCLGKSMLLAASLVTERILDLQTHNIGTDTRKSPRDSQIPPKRAAQFSDASSTNAGRLALLLSASGFCQRSVKTLCLLKNALRVCIWLRKHTLAMCVQEAVTITMHRSICNALLVFTC